MVRKILIITFNKYFYCNSNKNCEIKMFRKQNIYIYSLGHKDPKNDSGALGRFWGEYDCIKYGSNK